MENLSISYPIAILVADVLRQSQMTTPQILDPTGHLEEQAPQKQDQHRQREICPTGGFWRDTNL